MQTRRARSATTVDYPGQHPFGNAQRRVRWYLFPGSVTSLIYIAALCDDAYRETDVGGCAKIVFGECASCFAWRVGPLSGCVFSRESCPFSRQSLWRPILLSARPPLPVLGPSFSFSPPLVVFSWSSSLHARYSKHYHFFIYLYISLIKKRRAR